MDNATQQTTVEPLRAAVRQTAWDHPSYPGKVAALTEEMHRAGLLAYCEGCYATVRPPEHRCARCTAAALGLV